MSQPERHRRRGKQRGRRVARVCWRNGCDGDGGCVTVRLLASRTGLTCELAMAPAGPRFVLCPTGQALGEGTLGGKAKSF